MLIKDLFEARGESRSEFTWNQEMSNKDKLVEYGLVTKSGKIIRRELTHRAALALQDREDLVKKFGKLFVRKF